MNGERWLTIGLVLVVLATGAVSWDAYLRPPLEVRAETLAGIPIEISSWHGVDVEVETQVAAMLDADFNVQRSYTHPVGGLVWLYVGYYGTERGGRAEHTPWVCYPSNGWNIERDNVVTIDQESVGRVNELLVERDGERRLVHFWYQSSRTSGMLGELDQAIDRLISRLESGRADGSLVRLSIPLRNANDLSTARSQLITFGRQIAPLLQSHWPSESKAS